MDNYVPIINGDIPPSLTVLFCNQTIVFQLSHSHYLDIGSLQNGNNRGAVSFCERWVAEARMSDRTPIFRILGPTGFLTISGILTQYTLYLRPIVIQ